MARLFPLQGEVLALRKQREGRGPTTLSPTTTQPITLSVLLAWRRRWRQQLQLLTTEEFLTAARPSTPNSLPVTRSARPYSLASEGDR